VSIRCCCTPSGCCPGATIATTLFLVVNAGSGTSYSNATLTFGASPIGRGGSGWWSPATHDPNYLLTYYYQVLTCFSVTVYVITGGNPVSTIYNLSPTRAGNSCSPLLLVGGATNIIFSFISFVQFNSGNFTVHD
jgi:hypothetical protein